MKRLIALTMPLFASYTQAAAVAGAEQVQAVTLSNGMQLIVWPDHDIPNVAFYNFVRVGSRNEGAGKTGLAHFFEHMMFNGTSTRAPGEFDRVMEAAGGSNNAYTSENVTVYEDWFPNSALETVLQLEADRLQNLAFVPEVVESERNVVYSERRLRVEDSHDAHLMEQVQAAAFVAHPYGNPVIGWPSDIRAWTIDDLKAFFKTYYAPNNCTVVLVGDVVPSQVIALARKYFEAIPAQVPPAPVRTVEPEQEGERRVGLRLPAQTPLLQFAYHGLSSRDPDMPALELLMRILVHGDSSRLHHSLVEQEKVAVDVSGDVSPSFDPGLVWFMLTLPAGADTARAEQAFTRELERIATSGVTVQELAKARNMFLSEFWRQLSTINGKAALLGHYAVFYDDYRHLFVAPELYEKVTTGQVQVLAKRLLSVRNRTVGVLVPANEVAENTLSREQAVEESLP